MTTPTHNRRHNDGLDPEPVPATAIALVIGIVLWVVVLLTWGLSQ